jgi:hypothetical protein
MSSLAKPVGLPYEDSGCLYPCPHPWWLQPRRLCKWSSRPTAKRSTGVAIVSIDSYRGGGGMGIGKLSVIRITGGNAHGSLRLAAGHK